MRMRTKGALVVFIGLLVAFAVVFSFSYTDRYVSGRFHEAVDKIPVEGGRSFSLDAFLQYYDWDSVCVVLHGSGQDFSTLLGRDYELKSDDPASWSLVFLKEGAVDAEVVIERDFLEHPFITDESCFDRWGAVFYIGVDDEGRRRLYFAGH